jgi:hypothetical protein
MAIRPDLVLAPGSKPQLELGRPETDFGFYGHTAMNAMSGMLLGGVKMWAYFMDDACLPLSADSCRIARTRNGGYTLDFTGKRNAVRTVVDSTYLVTQSGSPDGKEVVMHTEFMPSDRGLLLRRTSIMLRGEAVDMTFEYGKVADGYAPSVVVIHSRSASTGEVRYTYAIDDYKPGTP